MAKIVKIDGISVCIIEDPTNKFISKYTYEDPRKFLEVIFHSSVIDD